MRTDSSDPIRLADYTVPSHLIENVHLDVTLDDVRTRVVASLSIKPNPAAAQGPLILDGDELELESISLDGKPLAPSHYTLTVSTLTLTNPPAGLFTLSIVTRLNPAGNTKLMGLYRSSGIYCTQCEAEGFRRITYFPDRPDVMAVFTTRITARADEAPVSISSTTNTFSPAQKQQPTPIISTSKPSSRMNISITGQATASPAATGSSCA